MKFGLQRLRLDVARLLGALACIAVLFAHTASPARADIGFDRPGGDYDKFVVKSADPDECSSRCERDARCRAWSFSYPRTTQVEAVCWLKNRVTPRAQNPCCVSGVRGAGVNGPVTKDVEFGIDRAGGDYKTFDTQPDNSGAACAAACKNDQQCRAWTYTRPGYQGAAAHCYLKAKVTIPRHKPCCLSGVVR
jgi:PAN domain